ncbi:Neurochondrin-domain-containing protein [Rhizophagus irregularis]|uniref:Neurochondrin-domain-containing protein n=1 Tax=Rhizophagus irregularis TaxID=588596 RepID=A0A2I1G4Z1_9GLOM|nr:Neurochondrin-domain-containing protein [Rhizophagus irregularis]
MASETEPQNEITRCLDLLSPESSDDAKFVALMLLPRLLQQDQETVKLVFGAMDFTFLERLMRTSNSSDSELPDNTLKTIAVNIISCCCAIDELLSKRQIHARIPTLSTLLSPEENEELTKDILKIFIRLSSANQAIDHLIDKNVISRIILCITATTNDEVRYLALQAVSYLTNSLITLTSTGQFVSDVVSLQEYTFTILNNLSLTFRTNQEKFKFDLLDFFVKIFSYMTDQFSQMVLLSNKTKLDKWTQNIRFGLKEILSSKLDNEQRDKALTLVMLLLNHIGLKWLFSPTTDLSLKQISTSSEKNVNDEFKFASLVVQLSCVEIRLMLDELAEQHEKQEFQLDKRHEVMLPTCYTILERSIEYLSQIENLLESQETSIELAGVNLDPELLLRLKGTMTETFRYIIEYLVSVKETTPIEKIIRDESVLASIRVLSAWFAEESSLEKEISQAIPFLIEICQYCLKDNIEVDLVKIVIPAFLNLTPLDQPREAFITHGGTQIIINCLMKSWSNKEDYNNISDSEVSDILGPLQILLNIVVSEREKFIVRNEEEIWKIVKIGLQISQILGPKLKSYEYKSNENQIILLGNTLLFCLFVVTNTSPSSNMFDKNVIKKIFHIAKLFYDDQNIISQRDVWKQVEEVVLLGKQVLDNNYITI